jgi:hypothetical protein
MNNSVINNYSRLRSSFWLFPFFLLAAIFLFLYYQDALSVQQYVLVQQDCFFYINSILSQFPKTIYNITQFGDEFVFLSFLSIFILKEAKVWEALLSGSLLSALFSFLLKNYFSVPRPAAVFDHHQFVIIGKALSGSTSLPSGHSITVFTILTVLLFAYMPSKAFHKIGWSILILSAGTMLVFSRVGVGAHYPLDVIIGSIIGYVFGLAGIFIARKYSIPNWVSDQKYLPVFMLVFLICCILLILRITQENLFVYYVSLVSVCLSLYKLSAQYVKR